MDKMDAADIVIGGHAEMQMGRRRITREDIALVLQYGQHVEGREESTQEACIELDGTPVTVVDDSIEHRFRNFFYVITVLRRRCWE